MSRFGKFTIFYFILIAMPAILHAKIRYLGQVVNIQTTTLETNNSKRTVNAKVELYQQEQLQQHSLQKRYSVLNKENQRVGSFFVDNRVQQKSSIILTGRLEVQQGQVYVGLNIVQEIADKTESILPDRVYRIFEKSMIVKQGKDDAEMVYIPKGPFIFGKSLKNSIGESYFTSKRRKRSAYEKNTYKKSIHPLELAAYYIDRYEVTNQQFAIFLNATGSQPPLNWSYQLADDLPVYFVSYSQANSYCHWANKRLPTEFEWEKAARGPGLVRYMNRKELYQYQEDTRDYPFGDTFDSKKCNTRENSKGLQSIYTLTDDSYYGLKGMCGNAAEWTSSWFMPYRGNTLTADYQNYGRRFKVIRGGSYDKDARFARSYMRVAGGSPTLSRDYQAGFRCAKSK